MKIGDIVWFFLYALLTGPEEAIVNDVQGDLVQIAFVNELLWRRKDEIFTSRAEAYDEHANRLERRAVELRIEAQL